MPWLPKRLVVVPVDFSDEGFAALDEALTLVAQPADVHVVHVLPTLEPTEPGVIWHTVDDASRRRHALQALAERLHAAKYQGTVQVVEIGDPGHVVSDYAQQHAAELIVLSSHGRTGLARMLIGSVAERIIRLAKCPVLVLRK